MSYARVNDTDGKFPNLIFGILALLGCLTLELPLFVAAVVAYGIIKTLQKHDFSMVFIFCLGYQLLFCVAGIIYRGFYYVYPSDHDASLAGLTSCLLMVGLLSLAFGLSAGMKYMESRPGWRKAMAVMPTDDYDISRLFRFTVFWFLISMFVKANASHVNQAVSQIVFRVLEFRFLFLFLLFSTILRQRRGYGYAWAAGVFAGIPQLVSGGSGFAAAIIVAFLAMLNESKLLTSSRAIAKSPARIMMVVLTAAILFVLAVVWNGAMKGHWRQRIASGELSGSLVSQLRLFANDCVDKIGTMDLHAGVRTTTGRISDVPVMMNRVLERIPEVVPFTNGELIRRAVEHVVKPRFLFPDKKNLGSDSSLVRRFAGIRVAGEEQNTSIGLGYLIEFYIDFGFVGLAICPFVLGFVIGVLSYSIVFVAPSRDIYHAMMLAILIQHFTSLDGSLSKIVGGLIMAFIAEFLFLGFAGKSLDKMLRKPNTRAGHRPRVFQPNEVAPRPMSF